MVMQPLPFSLGVVVIIVLATVQLALVDPVLAAVGVALFPALALLNHHYSRRVEPPAADARRRSARCPRWRTRASTAPWWSRRSASPGVRSSAWRRQPVSCAASGSQSAACAPASSRRSTHCPTSGTVALLAVGSWRISEGALSTGDLVQAMALFGILAFPMRVVGFLLEELPRAVVAHDRIAGVLGAPDRARPAEPVARCPTVRSRSRCPSCGSPR